MSRHNSIIRRIAAGVFPAFGSRQGSSVQPASGFKLIHYPAKGFRNRLVARATNRRAVRHPHAFPQIPSRSEFLATLVNRKVWTSDVCQFVTSPPRT